MSAVADPQQIVELTSAMGILLDAREWEALTRLFAARVDVDYTSLNGGEPVTAAREELVAGWQATLDGLDATQHLISNHQVSIDGDEATCIAHVQGAHRLATAHGDPLWIVGGRYDFRLRRSGPTAPWRISALKLTALWATGNRTIMELAAQRAAKRTEAEAATA